jgi:legumain
MKFAALASLATAAAAAKSDHWAILVTGSSGFGNYRHQADTCHAYQILKNQGIPEEQIILFNYDDAANSNYQHAEFKGKLFNKSTPAGTAGVDVYEGCNIDFKGKHVTAANLMSVMRGESVEAETSNKKTLKSDKDSKIFFYFADHGAPGLVAMPVGKYWYADDLYKTVKTMHENNMYKEMVMYFEACEGGSMFENKDYKSLNVYATTATNGKVSSWGTYCSPHDKVDGKSVGSCLGDLYSVNWMEDTDAHAKKMSETFKTQFDTVKKETTKSPVQEFGDLDIQKEPIGAFMGTQDEEVPKEKKFWQLIKSSAKSLAKDIFDIDQKMSFIKNESAVNSRDIGLHYLYNRVMLDATPEATNELTAALNLRMTVDKRFATMFPNHMEAYNKSELPTPTDFECYRSLIDTYESSCGKFDDYSMKYMGVLAAECEGTKAVPEVRSSSITKIQETCQNKTN